VEAIQAVSNGEEYFCNTVREKYSPQQKNNSLNKENSIVDSILTGRELEIIILIALEHSGKRLVRNCLSTNTVETHRKTFKLKAKNTISLVKFALKNKLIKS
jgi:DNA-binding NarL/FixJ family response regulator